MYKSVSVVSTYFEDLARDAEAYYGTNYKVEKISDELMNVGISPH